MSDRPTSPRVHPLPIAEQDEDTRQLLRVVPPTGSRPTNVFATLARHKGLLRKWLPFGGKLLAGKLSPRDRELLVLRTAWPLRI